MGVKVWTSRKASLAALADNKNWPYRGSKGVRGGQFEPLAITISGNVRRCRPECGWNSVWRILREHESIVSGNKVNRQIDWFCGDGLPTIDLAHVDLS